jgi:hypothetical protein
MQKPPGETSYPAVFAELVDVRDDVSEVAESRHPQTVSPLSPAPGREPADDGGCGPLPCLGLVSSAHQRRPRSGALAVPTAAAVGLGAGAWRCGGDGVDSYERPAAVEGSPPDEQHEPVTGLASAARDVPLFPQEAPELERFGGVGHSPRRVTEEDELLHHGALWRAQVTVRVTTR